MIPIDKEKHYQIDGNCKLQIEVTTEENAENVPILQLNKPENALNV